MTHYIRFLGEEEKKNRKRFVYVLVFTIRILGYKLHYLLNVLYVFVCSLCALNVNVNEIINLVMHIKCKYFLSFAQYIFRFVTRSNTQTHIGYLFQFIYAF